MYFILITTKITKIMIKIFISFSNIFTIIFAISFAIIWDSKCSSNFTTKIFVRICLYTKYINMFCMEL